MTLNAILGIKSVIWKLKLDMVLEFQEKYYPCINYKLHNNPYRFRKHHIIKHINISATKHVSNHTKPDKYL